MKKFFNILIFTLILLTTAGCFKRDDLEDIEIVTTVYPIEFLVDSLYGYNSEVKSIYPNEINVEKYNLTSKQIKDFSKAKIFVYNGLSNEKNIAAKLINQNNDLKIIDVTQGLEYTNSIEELWISPANYLMMAQNIKNSLKEYISNKYVKEEIDKNYNKLKISLSEIDAELKIIAETSDNKTIITSNKMFNYLAKYGFEVICLDETTNVDQTTIRKVKRLINEGVIKIIFTKQGEEDNNIIKEIKNETNVETFAFYTMTNLTENERKNETNYLTLAKQNIDAIKKEMYE